MQVSTLSSAYADQMLQRLLGMGQASSASGAGQNVPDPGDSAASAGQPPGAPPTPPPVSSDATASQRFASDTLSALLGLQQQQPSSGANALASKLVSSLDTNGDGQLSAGEITTALNQAGYSISSDTVQAGIAKLDTNGDGQLSTSELATAVSTQQQAAQAQATPHHHHHHHGGGGSASSMANNLLSALDSNGDGTLSSDEIAGALGQSASSSSTTSSNALQTAMAKLDTNGDGKVTVEELTAELQSAFGTPGLG